MSNNVYDVLVKCYEQATSKAIKEIADDKNFKIGDFTKRLYELRKKYLEVALKEHDIQIS